MGVFKTIYNYFLYLRYKYWNRKDAEKRRFLKELKILPPDETIAYIIDNKCNLSRYGDGEFYVMAGGSNGFQEKNERLAERLVEVIRTPKNDLLLCVPYCWINDSDLVLPSKLFFEAFKFTTLKTGVMPFVSTQITYGDSLLTRFYIRRKDKSINRISKFVNSLKKLWNDRDILIVEGEFTRSGIGNDLFDNARTIKRILCPATNAFDKYDSILEAIKTHAEGRLVLMSLGMTATVLASDLTDHHIWAIDLGHIDTEYMWSIMRVKEKVQIPGKYVNEIAQKSSFDELNDNEDYKAQIIATVK